MTIEDRKKIFTELTNRVRDAGVAIHGEKVTIEELVTSPAVGVAIFGEYPLEIDNDPGTFLPAWRFHQHHLLDFVQSYNTDEMLRYIEDNL